MSHVTWLIWGKKSGIWWFWSFWWFRSSIGFDSNDSALILMQRIFMLMIMNNGLYQEVCTISPLALFWSRMDFQINDLQLSWCRIIADWLSIDKKSFKFNAWSWGHEKILLNHFVISLAIFFHQSLIYPAADLRCWRFTNFTFGQFWILNQEVLDQH